MCNGNHHLFRTAPELKTDVEEILEDLDMNLSTAFNCFMNKVRDVGGIPFALTQKNKHRQLRDDITRRRRMT